MRIDESDGVSASKDHLVFAYYVTGHGFGHATRVVEVLFPNSITFTFPTFFFYLSLFLYSSKHSPNLFVVLDRIVVLLYVLLTSFFFFFNQFFSPLHIRKYNSDRSSVSKKYFEFF
jgi:hypothetical protein